MEFTIEVDVKDSDGKVILDANGVKRHCIQFELNIPKDRVEWHLKNIAKSLIAWMPDKIINISASVFNEISGTYMNMYSLYAKEDRFVTH